MSKTVQDYFLAGDRLQKAGRLDEAKSKYQQALLLAPTDIQVLSALSEIYYTQGKLEDALVTCHKIIQIQPNLARPYVILGKIFYARKNYEIARRAYLKAIQLDPNLIETHLSLGNVYQQIGDIDRAIFSYQKVISLDSHRASVYQNLILLLTQNNRLSDAHMYRQKLIELQAENNLLSRIKKLKKEHLPIKIIVGSSGTHQEGWISTDIHTLNLLNPKTWEQYFSLSSIDAILAEHVWEHLTQEEGIIAAKVCYQYLKNDGYLRIAVPDSFHPEPSYLDAVKPGGTGSGAEDHKVFYNYRSLKTALKIAGFQVDCLEYFNEEGKFKFKDWNPGQGKIIRSKRFDPRNQDGKLNYTSVIVDAKKIIEPSKKIATHSPNLNYLESSGWLNSMKRHQPVNYESQPIPWYTYPAIEFIEGNLKQNYQVFEYGGGYSTSWYAQRVSAVVTIENDRTWFEKIKSNMPENVDLSLVEDKLEYARQILDREDCEFDIIIIDGRYRNICASLCYKKLKKDGFIVFDNTDRAKYEPGINFLMSQGFKRIDFYGLIPSYHYKTCTSVFFLSDLILKNSLLPSMKKSCLGIPLGHTE